MRTLLITGGCGFIGSHLLDYLLASNRYNIINVDKLTYAGDLKNTRHLEKHSHYRFIQGDIADFAFIQNLFKNEKIDGLFHLAAESHVDNSINEPSVFIKTNIMGTFNLLECAKQHWTDKSNRFLHVSTDEVYGSLGETGYFTEKSPYQPNSPYSASKASSDLLVRSYHKTYGLNTVITNCSNNFGPRQHNEKLIPTIIRAALEKKLIPIYGAGTNIRDWLYVEDHVRALDLVYHQGESGHTYNIGSHHELSNLDLAKNLCSLVDKLMPGQQPYAELITLVTDRRGHDFRYAIDPQKMKALGWSVKHSFEDALIKTLKWYVEKFSPSST